VAPPAASRLTTAAPIPLVPPVTSARFAWNSALSRGFCALCIATSDFSLPQFTSASF
jgi:hypothetical protein